MFVLQELHSTRSKMADDMAEMQSVTQRQNSRVSSLESQTERLSKFNAEHEARCLALDGQLRELQEHHDQLVAKHETLQAEHGDLLAATRIVPVGK